MDIFENQDVTKRFPEVKAVAVDAGYKIPAIMKEIIDSQRIPCAPYRRPQTKDGFFKNTSMSMMNTMTASFAQITRCSAIPQPIAMAIGNSKAILKSAIPVLCAPSVLKAKPVKR